VAVSSNEIAVDSAGASPAGLRFGPRPPKFDFEAFFSGHTRVSGWFSDRFGAPKRHFCGDFFGQFEGDVFRLDEKLFYTDGIIETRTWHITVSDKGVFKAESESLIDGAHGLICDNTLDMKYSMKVNVGQDKHWNLDMEDRMILQPDGSLHNITHVSKWGIRIGTVSSQYLHHDGDQLCEHVLSGRNMELPKPEGKGKHLVSVVSK